MPAPFVPDSLAPRIAALGVNTALQIPTLRLPAAAWSALLAALAIPPGTASLPGIATIVGGPSGDTYQIEYAGRVASFDSPQRLAVGAAVHLARAPVIAPAGALPAPAVADSTPVSKTLETLANLLDHAFREPARPFPLASGAVTSLAAPQHFAATLADAVSSSGVFFEAHLSEWVLGKRSLGLVQAEAGSRAEMVAPEADSRAATVAPAADAPQRTAVSAGAAAQQQQLSLLVTGEMAFQFAPWPGQTASLALESAYDGVSNEASTEREFVARLQADLRGLGPVRATLSMTSSGIEVALQADSADTASSMRSGLTSLASALNSAGLQIRHLEVSHESQP